MGNANVIASLICAGVSLFFLGIAVGFMLADALDRKLPIAPSKNMMEPPEFMKGK
ncbi:MAG: hypothetical protein M0Z99_32120 [Betaproteobacteria bacterium]|nr:hypothetical protein [Betaproteobacteria bacterium]